MTTVTRYKCPYCNKENITKKEVLKQCPMCHTKFTTKQMIVIKRVEI